MTLSLINQAGLPINSQICRHGIVKSMWPHREEQIKRPNGPLS